MPAMTGCSATFEIVTKGSNGPKADSVDLGGELAFAADANMQVDFRKADLRFVCSDFCSTIGN